MSKVSLSVVRPVLALAIAVAGPQAGRANVTGPAAATCDAGSNTPAMLVRVTGFKVRTGVVRVQAYGGDPAHYFDKGTYLKRIDLRVPPAGPLDVCVPVPTPGAYAVSVRHDVDGRGKTGRSDGGGMSGNPQLSLFDIMFKRKPAADKVQIGVSRGVRMVPVTLNYLDGMTFGPVTAAR